MPLLSIRTSQSTIELSRCFEIVFNCTRPQACPVHLDNVTLRIADVVRHAPQLSSGSVTNSGGWPTHNIVRTTTPWVPHSSQSHRDEWGMLPPPPTHSFAPRSRREPQPN